ncbi:MAG: hypothetical protein BWY09_02896 [Candidatus Hydrogenedentes bacterium ADurb.Bin179]|nr:MAG: hypothetical protein BWY09_02896 [Candidatus Hydrogenedentes bacterium ADurb.Bin179]
MEYDKHGVIEVFPLLYIAFAKAEAGAAFDLLF